MGQYDHGIYEDCLGIHPDLLNRFYGVHGALTQRNAHQTGAGHPVEETESDDEIEEEWLGIGDSGNEEWQGIADSGNEEWQDIADSGNEEWQGIGNCGNEEWQGISGSDDEYEEWNGIIGDVDLELFEGEDLPDYVELVNHIGEEDEEEFNHEAVDVPKHTDPFQDEHLHAVFEAAFVQLEESGRIPMGYGIHPTEWDVDGYPAFGIIRSGWRGRKELRIALPDSVWRPRSLRWVQALYLMNQVIDMQSQ